MAYGALWAPRTAVIDPNYRLIATSSPNGRPRTRPGALQPAYVFLYCPDRRR
jgi:hypothetical protein